MGPGCAHLLSIHQAPRPPALRWLRADRCSTLAKEESTDSPGCPEQSWVWDGFPSHGWETAWRPGLGWGWPGAPRHSGNAGAPHFVVTAVPLCMVSEEAVVATTPGPGRPCLLPTPGRVVSALRHPYLRETRIQFTGNKSTEKKKSRIWFCHRELAPHLVGALSCHPSPKTLPPGPSTRTQLLVVTASYSSGRPGTHRTFPGGRLVGVGPAGLGSLAGLVGPHQDGAESSGLCQPPRPPAGWQREAAAGSNGLGWPGREHGGCDREHRGGGAPALAGPPFSGLASPSLTLVGPPGMHALPFLGASIPNNQQYSLGINEGALAFHAGEERHLLQRPKQLPGLPLLGEGAPHGTRDNAGWRKGSANPVKALG